MNKNRKILKRILSILCLLVTVGCLCFISSIKVHATEDGNGQGDENLEERTYEDDPGTSDDADSNSDQNIGNRFTVTVDNNGNGSIAGSLQILITLTLIALAPILLIMLTSFTRIIIVLHFTRTALNTQTAPPNQVLLGLALFLTIFIMAPVFSQVYNDAIVPYNNAQITQEEALARGIEPIRNFMIGQTQRKDVSVFMEIAGHDDWDGSAESVPTSVLIPSFIVSELRTAFIIGFVIYIPFLVIDMVVASVLMSMGMMMLPPTTISMPFKILLFVLADGWNLIIVNLVRTFY